MELGDTCSIDVVVDPIPDPECNDDWLGLDSPRDEGERFAGRRIQPLGLVRHDQNRRPGGCFCDELQHCEANHERVRGHRFGQSESSTKRGPL